MFILKYPKKKVSPILIHVYCETGKRFRMSTGISVDPKYFSNGRLRQGRGRIIEDLNSIQRQLNKIEQIVLSCMNAIKERGEGITANALRLEYQKAIKSSDSKPKTLLKLFSVWLEDRSRTSKMAKNLFQKYARLRQCIERFDKNVEVQDVDRHWLDNFAHFLQNDSETPINNNSLNIYIGLLTPFIRENKNTFHESVYGYKVKIKTYVSTQVYLTKEEIEVLEGLKLEGNKAKVRDLFLVGVYSGQRYSDYSIFEEADINSGMLIIKAKKTMQESYIPLHYNLKRILEKYSFKLPQFNISTVIRWLKEIGKEAGFNAEVKKVTFTGKKKEVIYKKKYEMMATHTARRTFITLAAENGMPDHIIMQITGITNVATLFKYKRTAKEVVKKEMLQLWHKKSDKEENKKDK